MNRKPPCLLDQSGAVVVPLDEIAIAVPLVALQLQRRERGIERVDLLQRAGDGAVDVVGRDAVARRG